ncbi:MAG: tetratricopeptide repeat protein, partial [Planctomycetales bacterium]|nr:tetratricopeptide repeat protein [Planctomycetales bacterium]
KRVGETEFTQQTDSHRESSDENATGSVATATSSLTRQGDVFGTPAYMAPEQARGDQLQVGTSSDVFSLGAILFEILVGKRLYSPVQEQDILTLAMRGPTAETWQQLEIAVGVDEELKKICKCCLQFDREDRPQDASWLADNVTDYVEGTRAALEQARLERHAAQVRATEETKRRRSAWVLSSGIVTAAILGILGILWQWTVAAAARDDAQTQSALAQQRFLDAKAAVDDYLSAVAGSGSLLSETPGTQALRRLLLSKAKDYYVAFTTTQPDSHELKSQLADAYQSLGTISRELESNDETVAVLRESIALRDQLISADYQIPEQLFEKMRTLNVLAVAYDEIGDGEQMIDCCQQVETIAKSSVLQPHRNVDIQLAKAMNSWGTALSRLGQDQESEAKQTAAVELLDALYRQDTNDRGVCVTYSEALRRLAVTEKLSDRRTEARQHLETALEVIGMSPIDVDPNLTADSLVLYASLSNSLARVYWDEGNSAQAIEVFETVCDELERVVTQNPLLAEPIRTLGNSYNGLAYYLTATSSDKTLSIFEKSIPLLERAVANRPQDLGLMKVLADAFAMRGEYWLQQVESSRALADINRCLEINTARRALAANDRDIIDLLIEGYKSQGIMLRRTGQPAAAATAYQQGIALIEQLEKEGRASTETLRSKAGIINNLAYLYQSEGQFEKSLDPYEQAAALYEKLAENDVVRIDYYYQASSLTNKGSALGKLGRNKEALDYLNRSIGMLETALEKRSDNRMLIEYLFEAYFYRAGELERSNDFVQAKNDLNRALELDENPFSDLARLKLLAVNVALGELEESVNAAPKILADKPSDFWIEGSHIAARAAVMCLDDSTLKDDQRTNQVQHYAAIAASQIEHAMELNHFLFINPQQLTTMSVHKRLWTLPEYAHVRDIFDKPQGSGQ